MAGSRLRSGRRRITVATATITLLANDHDPDGDAMRVIALTDPSIGTLVDHGDGTVTYTPNANANGTVIVVARP